MYYLTVAEAVERGDSLQGRWVRIAGDVPGDSIQWESKDFRLSFDVVQDGERVHAVYTGVQPDNLIDGSSVVLEGTFLPNGDFDVDRLLVQCVSKYEAAVDEQDPNFEYEEIDGVLYEMHEAGGFGGR